MPFLNPFFLGPMLLVAAFGLGTVAGLAVLGFGLWKRKRWAKWLGGIAAGAGVFWIAVIAGCTTWMWSPTTRPERVFRAAFGKPPPPGVTNVVGEAGGFLDSASFSIQFGCDELTFRELLPPFLVQTNAAAWAEVSTMIRRDPPWPQLVGGSIRHFTFDSRLDVRTNGQPGFSANWYALARDPVSGTVQFHWLGID